MKTHLQKNSVWKVMPLLFGIFFSCASGNARAQNNRADSSVYNADSNAVKSAERIFTTSAGAGNLDVFNPMTKSINLQHAISGYINISNQFRDFRITSTSMLSGEESAVLSVYGGDHLTVEGGKYIGGETTVFSNNWKNGIGGILSGVATARLSSVEFSGGRIEIDDVEDGFPPEPGQSNDVPRYYTPFAQGADALYVTNSHLILSGDSILQGGEGSEAGSSKQSVHASGGRGLTLHNSSAVISNGAYRGGSGGTADPAADYTGHASGGDALYASQSVVHIHAGIFSGGKAGTVAGRPAQDGAGIQAVDGSSISISNGQFSGSASARVENSKLFVYGGTFTDGGLISETTRRGTNTLLLQGGTFSRLDFRNGSSNGIQFVTVSNAAAFTVSQHGGVVMVTNLENQAFQQVNVVDGSMIFARNFTLNSGGLMNLSNKLSRFSFREDMTLDDESMVHIGLGHIEIDGTFTASDGSVLQFLIMNTNEMGSISTRKAVLESNVAVIVDARLANFAAGSVTNTVITAADGISADINDLILDVRSQQNTNVIGRTTWTNRLTPESLSFIFNTEPLNDYWDNPGGPLGELAEELDEINHREMNNIIETLGKKASRTAVEQTYFMTLNTFQAAMQGLYAAVGLTASRGTEFLEQLKLPTGEGGRPNESENDWRFWGKYYGQFYHRDRDVLHSAYDTTLQGGAIGMDKSFGPILLGLSGGMGSYRLKGEHDARQTLNAAHGAVYSTIGTELGYLDAGLAYGYNKVESRSIAPFLLNGEFDAHLISGHIGGGFGFNIPKTTAIIRPEVSAHYTLYKQDAYTETGTRAVPRSFDSFDADSLRADLGLNASMLHTKAFRYFSLKFEGRAHWLHEFNTEPGNLTFRLQENSRLFPLTYPILDEDTVRLGVGFSFFNTEEQGARNVLLQLDFDELIGHNSSSHNFSAKAIYAF